MKDDDINKRIYSTFAGVASSLGFSEVHGTIIGAVLVANKPLSLQDLAKSTGYSLSSVSISIDLLELVGIVRKVRNQGDRKIYVKLEGDLLDTLKKAFLLKMQKEINATKTELENYTNVSKNPNTTRTLKILKAEVDRLQKYIVKLSEIGIPS
jgi:DNA-binding transcriptional regulator GbsR (MarR family)